MLASALRGQGEVQVSRALPPLQWEVGVAQLILSLPLVRTAEPPLPQARPPVL